MSGVDCYRGKPDSCGARLLEAVCEDGRMELWAKGNLACWKQRPAGPCGGRVEGQGTDRDIVFLEGTGTLLGIVTFMLHPGKEFCLCPETLNVAEFNINGLMLWWRAFPDTTPFGL